MEQDISEEEKEALEAEHRADQGFLKALLWATECSRDSYVCQFDSSSPVLYEAMNYFRGKMSDPTCSNDYAGVLQLINDQIDN